MDKELIRVENDIRQGGKVIYTFNNNLEIGGEYRQVQGNEELVYSWIWNLPEDLHHKREYLMAVRFKCDKQQSELEVVQENFANEQFIGPHQQGWERALLDLQDYLEKT